MIQTIRKSLKKSCRWATDLQLVKNRNWSNFMYTPSDQQIGHLYAMLSVNKTTFKTSTINTSLEMPPTNNYTFITLASRKDQEGHFIMTKNFHDSAFSTMLKSWLSCFYFTYAAHWANRSRLDIHWNQCVYFFWLILLLFLLNIDLFFPEFYGVQILVDSHDRRYLFYFKKVTSLSYCDPTY